LLRFLCRKCPSARPDAFMVKSGFSTGVVMAVITVVVMAAAGVSGGTYPFDIQRFDAGVLDGETLVKVRLPLRNITSEPVRIRSVQPSCGCTNVTLDRWMVDPGESVDLHFLIDTRGKIGRIVKSIDIFTDRRTQPYTITLVANIEHVSEREVDPSVIFRGGCRNCHIGENVEEKKGEVLFNALCYLCHKDGKAFPDLGRSSLRDVISKGVKGTSMPGFLDSHGGPLTGEQIESLVGFLSEENQY